MVKIRLEQRKIWMRFELSGLDIEHAHSSYAHLRCNAVMVGFDFHIWIERQCTFASHFGFGLSDVLLVEQKLPIQIADINRIQINL